MRGGIYRGEWDLHQLEGVSLALGGGRAAKPRGRLPRWSGLHQLSPPTWASPVRVDAWQTRLRLNRLKPRPIQPGVWPTWSTCEIHLRGDGDFDIW
jgi:hypothetical protein